MRLLLLALACSAMMLPKDMPAGLFAGTWKMNVEASKIYPGPKPQWENIIIEPDGRVTCEVMLQDGQTRKWSYKPVEGEAVSIDGRPNSTVISRHIDSHTNEQLWNNNGHTAKGRATLSKDGMKTYYHIEGESAEGKLFHEDVVYEKQP
jgi:hypothetical protein